MCYSEGSNFHLLESISIHPYSQHASVVREREGKKGRSEVKAVVSHNKVLSSTVGLLLQAGLCCYANAAKENRYASVRCMSSSATSM